MRNSPEDIDLQRIAKGDKEYWDSLALEAKRWVGRELIKPAYKGLVSLVDVPFIFGNASASEINRITGTNIKPWKHPSEHASDFVDYVTEGRSKGEPNSVPAKAIEFGASMYGGGLAAKGLKEGSKISPWLGSTEKGQVKNAFTMGAATQGAEDLGLDPLTATGVGLGVGMGTSAIGRNLKNVKAKNIDLDVYDANGKKTRNSYKIKL